MAGIIIEGKKYEVEEDVKKTYLFLNEKMLEFQSELEKRPIFKSAYEFVEKETRENPELTMFDFNVD